MCACPFLATTLAGVNLMVFRTGAVLDRGAKARVDFERTRVR